MRKNVWLTAFILLLVATAIFFTTKTHEDAQVKTTMSHLIETDSSESIPDVLTVKDANGKSLDLAIKDIPVYNNYLKEQEDIKAEIERTQLEVLHLPTQEHFILLKYNCGNKQCSTILVKKSDSKITSIALADGIFQDYKISPENDELLLRYGYNEGGELVRHILIAVDLLKMKIIPFESTQLAKEYMYTPTWPIVDYQWIENNRFIIEAGDLESPEFEAVKNWYASNEKKTKKIEILLNREKRLEMK